MQFSQLKNKVYANIESWDYTRVKIFQLQSSVNVKCFVLLIIMFPLQHFLDSVNQLWLTMHLDPGLHPINFMMFDTRDDLLTAYWKEPTSIPIAVIFETDDPVKGNLK